MVNSLLNHINKCKRFRVFHEIEDKSPKLILLG